MHLESLLCVGEICIILRHAKVRYFFKYSFLWSMLSSFAFLFFKVRNIPGKLWNDSCLHFEHVTNGMEILRTLFLCELINPQGL